MIEIIILLLLLIIWFFEGIFLFFMNQNKYQNKHQITDGGYDHCSVDPIERKIYIDETLRPIILKNLDKTCETIQYYKQFPKSELEYRAGCKIIVNNTLHIGQFKLMLSELEFLTHRLNTHLDSAFVVYAGSAPCNHLPAISKLFPNVQFLLVDPNKHNLMTYKNRRHFNQYDDPELIKKILYFKCNTEKKQDPGYNSKINFYNFKTKKIESVIKNEFPDNPIDLIEMIKVIKNNDISKITYFILEDYFTDELSDALHKKSDPFYFISDIRTNLGNIDFEDYPSDIDIIWNSAQQYIWIHKMKPLCSMVKFRPPFYNLEEKKVPQIVSDSCAEVLKINPDLNLLELYQEDKFKYIKGEIYIQAFPGTTSSESRLIIEDLKELIFYDPKDWEDKFFYYNKVTRPFCYHDNKAFFDEKMGIDACGDCDLMLHLYKEYYKKFYKTAEKHPDELVMTIKSDIKYVLSSCFRSLIEQDKSHGRFFKKGSIAYLLKNL